MGNNNEVLGATYLAKTVQVVDFYRMQSLSDNFPPVEQGEMSDEEYKEKLQEQYLALRTLNYEYAVKAQGYDMYNFSRNMTVEECRAYLFQETDTKAEGLLVENNSLNKPDLFHHANPNDSIWSANTNSAIFSASKVVKGSKRGVSVGEQVTKSNLAHCAQTAACIVTATCDMIGLKDVTDGSDVCNAAHIHGGYCAGKNSFVSSRSIVGFGGDKYSHAEDFNKSNGKTLGELIKEGKIKPGAIISEYVDNVTGSKMHALTIIDVKKNESGNVVGYTVMDNNGGGAKTRIRECKIGEVVDDVSRGCNNKKVVYTNVADWAQDQFVEEMNGKSIEELQAMIYEEKENIRGTIRSLAVAEKTLLCDDTYKNNCGRSRIQALAGQQARIISSYNEYADKNKRFLFDIYKTGFYGIDLNNLGEAPIEDEVAFMDFRVGEDVEKQNWSNVNISSEREDVKKEMKYDNIRANMTMDEMVARNTELEKSKSVEGVVSAKEVDIQDKEVENSANIAEQTEYKKNMVALLRQKALMERS